MPIQTTKLNTSVSAGKFTYLSQLTADSINVKASVEDFLKAKKLTNCKSPPEILEIEHGISYTK